MNDHEQGHRCYKCEHRWWDTWCQANPVHCWKDEIMCPSCVDINTYINGRPLNWSYVEDSFEAYVLNVRLGVHDGESAGT
jgi:hypothetical protein